MQDAATENEAVCREMVWRGETWTGNHERCGRRVKARGVCGIHLRPLLARDARLSAQGERILIGEALSRFLGFSVHGYAGARVEQTVWHLEDAQVREWYALNIGVSASVVAESSTP